MDYAWYEAGELVWARILNSLENRASEGKGRPVVLIRRVGGKWLAMGLTTNRRYRDGAPRVAIPNHEKVGLADPGFLWADHLTPVAVIDLGNHIGWIDHDLAETVIQAASLNDEDAEELRQVAARHHLLPSTDSTGVA